MKKLLFLLIFVSFSCFGGDFSPEIGQNFAKPTIIGQNKLRIWGFSIYDIALFGEKGQNYRKKFAIKIKYLRNFSKEELVDSSISEISRIKKIDEKKRLQYRLWFDKIFTDVRKNDRKTAIVDSSGIKLYYNDILLGEVKNRQFGLDFADIWLDKEAKYQKMRKKLLNL